MLTMKQISDALQTATSAYGRALARQLAQFAPAEASATHRDMVTHPSAPPAPSVEMLAATYFQTVATANAARQR